MIKVGVDLVAIHRLKEVNPRILVHFIQRVYTEREQAQAQGDFETLAGLFAAKEAGSKALGTGIGKAAWQNFEILHASTGEPSIYLSGFAQEVANFKGLKEWAVSISHEGGFAIATVIAQG